MLEIGHHPQVGFRNISFNLDTLISMAIVSAVIIILAVLVKFLVLRRKDLSIARVAVEAVYQTLEGIPVNVMGRPGAVYTGLVATLFIYILFSNLLGLVPVNAIYSLFFEKMFGAIPELPAPTADLNITGGLALMVFLSFHYTGIRNRGLKYFKSSLSLTSSSSR